MKPSLLSILCVLRVLGGSLSAATPTDELLQRVPKDIGFVVVVQDLRGLSERLPGGPFAKKLLQTAPGKIMTAAPEWKQLAEVDALLQKEMGATAMQLRDGLLGDAVVFLYRPDPNGNSAKDESAVLIHARDPKLAAQVFRHIDEAQTKSGQLKGVSTRKHNGNEYAKRSRTDEDDEFHYQRGPLLAFGSSELLIQQVIDADRAPANGAAPLAKRMHEAGVDRATMVWWVNPRAFDALLAAKQRAVAAPEAVVLAALVRFWQALDVVALSCQFERDAEVRLTFAARPEALPASVRQFLAELAQPSALLAAFPDDALATISGRFHLPAALAVGSEFMPPEQRNELGGVASKTIGAALGPDVLNALPNHAGPDWGICLSAPADAADGPWPVLLAAVRLTEKAGGPPVASRVVDGLNALATVAVIGFNAKNAEPLTLQFERHGGLDIRVVTGKSLPASIRPAYAWKAGYLVFASTPQAINRFTPPGESATPATTAEAPLVKISFRGLAKYLRDHRAAAAQLLMQQEKITTAIANERIDAALGVCDLFDALDLRVRSAPGRAVVSLRLRPAVGLVD